MVAKTGIPITQHRHPSVFISLPQGAPGHRQLCGGYGALTRSAVCPPQKGAFFAPDFHQHDPTPWWVPEEFRVSTGDGDRAPRSLVSAPDFPPLDRGTVEAEVEAILTRIEKGDLQKIVPVWFSRSTWIPSGEEAALLSRNARALGSNQMAYGLLGAGEGMVGVTPEILFRVDAAGILTTMALAGTQRIESGKDVADLLADPKERGEHQLVIDFFRGALDDLGAVVIGETAVREVPGLRHLFTPITLHPRAVLDFQDLVERLHPTPALGAVPREPGLEWLRERERQVPRGRHGAPFGVVLPSGEMICLVAIRNIQWDQRGSMIGAGCGIVSGSIPAYEYGEAEAKIASVKAMVGIRG